MPRWVWGLPPSAARTACPAPSSSWMCPHAGLLCHCHRQGQQGGLHRVQEAREHCCPHPAHSGPRDRLPQLLLPEGKLQDRGADDRRGHGASACAVGYGGIAEALFKMGLGNHIGFKMRADMPTHRMFEPMYGSIVLEMVSDSPQASCWARPPGSIPLKAAVRRWIWQSCRRSGRASWSLCTPTARQAPPWKRSTAS